MVQKVLAYCKKEGLSMRAFEQKCGLADGTLRHWKISSVTPTLKTMKKIEKGTGIKLEEWLR